MIKTFKDRQTKAIFDGEKIPRIDAALIKRARRRLELLNAATRIEDLYFPPSNRLHALGGHQPTRYSISVDKQWRWRMTFEWSEGNAYEACFEDYH